MSFSFKQGARAMMFLFPCLFFYLLFLISFFGGQLPFLEWISLSPMMLLLVWIACFLFFLHLCLPDMKRIGIGEWQICFVLSFLICMLVFWGPDVYDDIGGFMRSRGFQLVAGIVLMLGIMLLLDMKFSSIDNRVRIHFRSLHYVGVFVFSLFVSGCVAFYSFGQFKHVPFSCEEIQSSQDELLSLFLSPVRAGSEVLITGKDATKKFLQTDLKDVLEGYVLAHQVKESSSTFLKDVRHTLILEALDEKKEIDETVCEFIMNLISSKRHTPGLQYSVVFLMFLVLYPFVSLVFFFISILSYITCMMGKKLGLRKISTSLQEVEDIQ